MAKILVIDDEEQILTLLKKLLEHGGHVVLTADNGSVGLKLIRQEPVDLVITDIFMPEKEGLETIIEIKKEFPETKIIAMSGGGNSGSDFLPLTKPLGAIGSLHKPFTKDDLFLLVDQVLGSA